MRLVQNNEYLISTVDANGLVLYCTWASVGTVPSTHPCVSSCVWVNTIICTFCVHKSIRHWLRIACNGIHALFLEWWQTSHERHISPNHQENNFIFNGHQRTSQHFHGITWSRKSMAETCTYIIWGCGWGWGWVSAYRQHLTHTRKDIFILRRGPVVC